MAKFVIGVVASAVLTGLTVGASAQDTASGTASGGSGMFGSHFAKDWGFTLGYKAWVNTWSIPQPLEDGAYDADVQIESKREISSIPAFSIRYRNFVLGGSYFQSRHYEFHRVKVPIVSGNNANTLDTSIIQVDPTAKRKEWDLTVGYYVDPSIALLLGYKSLDREYAGNRIELFPRDGAPLSDTLYRTSTKGPFLGIAVSAPLGGSGFGFYGTGAYGWLKTSYDDGNSAGGGYNLLEAGLSYSWGMQSVTVSAVTLTAGYRTQRFTIRDQLASGADVVDATGGPTLGISVTF